MTREYLIAWIKVLPISMVFVFGSAYLLKTLDQIESPETEIKAPKYLTIEDLKTTLGHQYFALLIDCQEKYEADDDNWQKKCDQDILDKHNNIQTQNDIVVESNITDNNILIYFIYFLLALSLNFQVTLFWNINKFNELEKIHCFYISDWAINSAPILGVLGTVISFALLVGSAQINDIQEIFKDYFFDAAITTVVGGFIYIINLFLNIFIQPKANAK